MQMEAFFTAAKDADVLLYNSTTGEELFKLSQLVEKNALFAEFKAVRDGNVWCMEKDMFQQSSATATVIEDLNRIFTGGDTGELRFLHALT